MSMFTTVVQKEDSLYVAQCPEVGTASQGETIEETIKNLQEATELYLEEFPVYQKPGYRSKLVETANAGYNKGEGCPKVPLLWKLPDPMGAPPRDMTLVGMEKFVLA